MSSFPTIKPSRQNVVGDCPPHFLGGFLPQWSILVCWVYAESHEIKKICGKKIKAMVSRKNQVVK